MNGYTSNKTQKQQSSTLKQLASNKNFAKIADNDQKVKMKSLYNSFVSISKELVPAFHEAIESGNVENLDAVLEDIKSESAKTAKAATDAANKYIAEFNTMIQEAQAGQLGGTLGARNINAAQLQLPYFNSLQDFAIYANLAAKNGDTLFPLLLSDISAKLGLGGDSQENFGPTMSTIAESDALDDDPVGATDPVNVPRAKNNVKSVSDSDPYKTEVNAFYERLKSTPVHAKLVEYGANIIKQIRIANQYAALAAGIQKRQEVLKMMNTNAKKKLLNDIASGQAFLLDPEDPAFALDKDTAKIIKHDFGQDFKYTPRDTVAATPTDGDNSLDNSLDDDEPIKKEAMSPGVGKIDTRGTSELYEERMVQDVRQSKIVKINEGWKAYAAKQKGKKITGEGDKFNIVMG
jgi:hypothetical protein